VTAAHSVAEWLTVVTDAARDLLNAHQATTSVALGGNWRKAAHAVSLSEKYAAWRTYDEPPDGSGIYRLVSERNRPMRLTQAQLEAHPAWRGFGVAVSRHPPMRGWLAAPLHGRGGRSIGVIQLSDKVEGEFTSSDEATLVALARLASTRLGELRRAKRVSRTGRRSVPPCASS
jgi:GAF domain-containing protein